MANEKPRVAAGSPTGGQWMDSAGAEASTGLLAPTDTPSVVTPDGATWRKLSPNVWSKVCPRCGGTGWLGQVKCRTCVYSALDPERTYQFSAPSLTDQGMRREVIRQGGVPDADLRAAAAQDPTVSPTDPNVRYLTFGVWVLVAKDEWAKQCGKCGGKGRLAGFESVDNASCWRCHGSGREPRVANRTSEQLDQKEADDLRKRAETEANYAAAAARYAEHERIEKDEAAAAAAQQEHRRQERLATTRHLDAREGDKVQVAGTIRSARTITTEIPETGRAVEKRLIIVRTDDGVDCKMFTTAAWAWSVTEGEPVVIDAVVKKHTDYKGARQTELTRPKRGVPTLPAPPLSEAPAAGVQGELFSS